MANPGRGPQVSDLEAMLERIKRDSGINDPEQVAMLARTATKATELAARSALGEDVEDEMQKLKAIALNLDENVRRVAGMQIALYLQSFFAGILTKLLLR